VKRRLNECKVFEPESFNKPVDCGRRPLKQQGNENPAPKIQAITAISYYPSTT